MNVIRVLRGLERRLYRLRRRLELADEASPARSLHAPAHPRLSAEAIRSRTDEYNRNAERHWVSVLNDPSGMLHALNKPVSGINDTPALLYRVGLVLDALDLGVGRRVLDFGAGSGWLSSILNRLRCRTVSIDVSAAALDVAREMFRNDARHHSELAPEFRVYDGHHIPLEDASCDRIVCFDAFHHVPNPDEVLGEMFRVLKPGGRAVFAEPGGEHSHGALSIAEMEIAGILESDFDVRVFVEQARRAGFEEALAKPYPDPSLEIAALDFVELTEGRDGAYPFDAARAQMSGFCLAILVKDKARATRDSRGSGALLAKIAPRTQGVRGRAGSAVEVEADVTNCSDFTWLDQEDVAGGYVRLSIALLDEKGDVLAPRHLDAALPGPVSPGQTVHVASRLALPPRVGRYALRYDVVSEHVTRGAHHGSETPTQVCIVDSYHDSRDPAQLKAEIAAAAKAFDALPGEQVRLRLHIANTGTTLWLHEPSGKAGTVMLGGHYEKDGVRVVSDAFRIALPRSVAPGELVDLDAVFPAPPTPGAWTVSLDLVDEGLFWFVNHGSLPLALDVQVKEGFGDSRSPAVLDARIVCASGRLQTSAGGTCSLNVEVRNSGNTVWRASEQRQRGVVFLGGHWLREGRELLLRDAFRIPLPREVAPGETAALTANVLAPSEPGEYVLQLDMVDEGITWFADQGSRTLEVLVKAR